MPERITITTLIEFLQSQLSENSDLSDGFRVIVDGPRYGRFVRVAPGLSGENLGNYPNGTHVYLLREKVQKWIDKQP